jgi:hypothetical protein
MTASDYVVVYRGFDPAGLDLVESMLRAEGLEPRRLGKAQAALLGIGNAALEQLIAVAPEHESAALALIAASQQASEPGQLEALEAQALQARVPPDDVAVEGPSSQTVRLVLLLAAIVVVTLFALRSGWPIAR